MPYDQEVTEILLRLRAGDNDGAGQIVATVPTAEWPWLIGRMGGLLFALADAVAAQAGHGEGSRAYADALLEEVLKGGEPEGPAGEKADLSPGEAAKLLAGAALDAVTAYQRAISEDLAGVRDVFTGARAAFGKNADEAILGNLFLMLTEQLSAQGIDPFAWAAERQARLRGD